MTTKEAVEVLKKYHDKLHEIYADYVVYMVKEDWNEEKEKAFDIMLRSNTVKHAVEHAITIMESQYNHFVK